MSLGSSSSPDKALFETVHKLLSEDPAAAPANRRTSERRAYRRRQLIAPYDGIRSPDAGEFRPLDCEDLSERGLAYYECEAPTYRQLVLALGPAPFRFIVAEVARFKPVKRPEGVRYLVGCRFTGRLNA